MTTAGYSSPPGYIPRPRARRAAAALSVAIHRVTFEATSPGGSGAVLAAAIGAAVPWGAGVDVFFVISGFVMPHASEPLFGGGWSGVRRFPAQRAARIVPLYWCATASFLMVAAVDPGVISGGTIDPWTILASFSFIPYYEMEFHALFAMRAAGQIWRRGGPATPGTALLFIVTTLVFSCSLALAVDILAERHVTRVVRV